MSCWCWCCCVCVCCLFCFFQAEDGIRDLVRSRGLGDVYKRQVSVMTFVAAGLGGTAYDRLYPMVTQPEVHPPKCAY